MNIVFVVVSEHYPANVKVLEGKKQNFKLHLL